MTATTEVWQAQKVAVVRWGKGEPKRHLYAWDEVRTICGRDAPTDWFEVEGGVHYEAIRPDHYGYTGDCSNCILSATTENIERCATESEWVDAPLSDGEPT